MGANGGSIGRAYAHSLGTIREAGVTSALEVIAKGMDISMALCGKQHIMDVDQNCVLIPENFTGHWAA